MGSYKRCLEAAMIVLMVFCTVSVGLRMLVRKHIVKAFGLDDIAVFIAYVSISTVHHHLAAASSIVSLSIFAPHAALDICCR